LIYFTSSKLQHIDIIIIFQRNFSIIELKILFNFNFQLILAAMLPLALQAVKKVVIGGKEKKSETTTKQDSDEETK
jgi:hypothetical protein